MEGPAGQTDLLVAVFRAVAACVGLLVFARRVAPRAWRLDARAGRHARRAAHAGAFVLLAAAAAAAKAAHLVFVLDCAVALCLFAAYLLAEKRTGFRNAVYMAVTVFLCSDFCVALFNVPYIAAGPDLGTAATLLTEALFAATLLGLCLLMARFAPTQADTPVPAASFVSLLLSLLPYLFIRSTTFLYDLDGHLGSAMQVILLLTIAATLGTVAAGRGALEAEAEKARRLQLEVEMAELQSRYRVRREAMEAVNRRYHDMVRFAHTCAQDGRQASVAEYLEQRMADEMPAQALVQTGIDVLDAVLWDAMERCGREGIRLVPNVDPSGLGFLSPFDLRTIVGNALDNAIEAAGGVADPERREIRLRVGTANGVAFFKTENCYAREPLDTGGRLESTKADDGEPHGYGIENIRRTVQAYGGSLAHEACDGVFSLTAMVPLP